MNIILSGYGKMGKALEKVALARGHQVIAIIDQPEDWDKIGEDKFKDSVVLEFSVPSAAVDNIRHCFDRKVPVVTGTTGWNEKLAMVKKWAEEEQQSIFFASNYSIGVNLMMELARVLSGLLNMTPSYEITLEETHHIHKLDSPSGTAIKLAETIIAGLMTKTRWVNQPATHPEELAIISHREDEIPGIHSIICESAADKLIIRHEAKDRSGFATGAVMAAEWLKGKTGFFEMKDMLALDQLNVP